MESLIIELRAAEGGQDSKLLIQDQFNIYRRWATRRSLEIVQLVDKPGIIVFKVIGKGAKAAFGNESGGHQWQRIPPTEKKGRVHTSLITVAVLPEPDRSKIKVDEKDLKMDIARGSGNGGQKRNKTETAVRLTHIPTGISVHIDSRNQNQNKVDAMDVLMGRLQELADTQKHQQRVNDRKAQIGDGERANAKVRVIREKDAIVINNLNGNKISYKDYCRGNLSELL